MELRVIVLRIDFLKFMWKKDTGRWARLPRWIVLLIFSLGSGIVGIVWETLIPIASTL